MLETRTRRDLSKGDEGGPALSRCPYHQLLERVAYRRQVLIYEELAGGTRFVQDFRDDDGYFRIAGRVVALPGSKVLLTVDQRTCWVGQDDPGIDTPKSPDN